MSFGDEIGLIGVVLGQAGTGRQLGILLPGPDRALFHADNYSACAIDNHQGGVG